MSESSAKPNSPASDSDLQFDSPQALIQSLHSPSWPPSVQSGPVVVREQAAHAVSEASSRFHSTLQSIAPSLTLDADENDDGMLPSRLDEAAMNFPWDSIIKSDFMPSHHSSSSLAQTTSSGTDRMSPSITYQELQPSSSASAHTQSSAYAVFWLGQKTHVTEKDAVVVGDYAGNLEGVFSSDTLAKRQVVSLFQKAFRAEKWSDFMSVEEEGRFEQMLYNQHGKMIQSFQICTLRLVYPVGSDPRVLWPVLKIVVPRSGSSIKPSITVFSVATSKAEARVMIEDQIHGTLDAEESATITAADSITYLFLKKVAVRTAVKSKRDTAWLYYCLCHNAANSGGVNTVGISSTEAEAEAALWNSASSIGAVNSETQQAEPGWRFAERSRGYLRLESQETSLKLWWRRILTFPGQGKRHASVTSQEGPVSKRDHLF